MKNNKNFIKNKKSEIPEIGIGMLGYKFMGKAHSIGYLRMPYIFWPPPAIPKLIKICGRNEHEVKEAAKRYGYLGYCTDWHKIVNDNRIAIFVNGGTNDIHAEPCIEAAKNGKHIVCEKPLAKNAVEAKKMFDAVLKAKIKHICNFNYRQVPAVALAKKLVMEGKIGKIYHFRANYLQEWATDPNLPLVWNFDKEIAGSGTVGGLSHIVDLARWFCGEPESIIAITKTFIKERPLISDSSKKGRVTVDDAYVSALEFKNGAVGLLEGSNMCLGRKNYEAFEINGELGSICWNLEDLNYLNVYFKEEKYMDTKGFHKINVTESYHPYYIKWWPAGHTIGWGDTFVHTAFNIINAVINDTKLEPMIATFEDGYKAAVICDAIIKSAETGKKIRIIY